MDFNCHLHKRKTESKWIGKSYRLHLISMKLMRDEPKVLLLAIRMLAVRSSFASLYCINNKGNKKAVRS